MQSVGKKKILKKVISGIGLILSLSLIGVFVFLVTGQTKTEETNYIIIITFLFGWLGSLTSLGELFGFPRENKNSKK